MLAKPETLHDNARTLCFCNVYICKLCLIRPDIVRLYSNENTCATIEQWDNGEPNNPRTELCAEVNRLEVLNNMPCSTNQWYICEFDTENYEIAIAGGKTFYVGHRERVTWDTARDNCDAFGGKLATFSSDAEYDLMASIFDGPSSARFGDRAWIGMTSQGLPAGKWKFIDGQTDFWYVGQTRDTA